MLLTYPRGSTTPTPDAASDCHYSDTGGLTYQCTMREGLKFSNGDKMTSQDVKFSVDRMKKINWATGPSSLISDVKSVNTPDDKTVVFQLKAADATFPAKLATPAAAILDSKVYDPAKPYAGFKLVGSGPYTLDSTTTDKQGNFQLGEFNKNSHYKGILKLNNSRVDLRMFADSDKMEDALKDGSIDVMSRTMSPDQINGLEASSDPDVKLTESPGGQARYLFLNTASPDLKSKAVRQAIAWVIDRQAITRDVYKRTADPLYSVVPQGISGHVNAFFSDYPAPSVSRAKRSSSRQGSPGRCR